MTYKVQWGVDKNNSLTRLYAALSSLKLTVSLLAVFIAAAAAAGIIPQGFPSDYYFRRFPPVLARLITTSGLDNFGSSPVLVGLAGLFWLNLAACTLPRLGRTFRGFRILESGPDLVHLGLLLLIPAAVLPAGTGGGIIPLKPGEAARIPAGIIRLDKIEHTESGGWNLLLALDSADSRISGGGEAVVLRVNHPLDLGKFRLILSFVDSVSTVILTDDSDRSFRFAPGEGGRKDDMDFLVQKIEPYQAVMLISGKLRNLAEGDAVGDLRVAGFGTDERAGILLVERTGREALFVTAGFIISAGALLSFLRRIVRRRLKC